MEVSERILDVFREVVGEEDGKIPLVLEQLPASLRYQALSKFQRIAKR
jgi:hypothetical protein